jgi:hypothetical protein
MDRETSYRQGLRFDYGYVDSELRLNMKVCTMDISRNPGQEQK